MRLHSLRCSFFVVLACNVGFDHAQEMQSKEDTFFFFFSMTYVVFWYKLKLSMMQGFDFCCSYHDDYYYHDNMNWWLRT